VLSIEEFHEEVGSWPMVACDIREGKYLYLFGGMVPHSLPGEIVMDTRKRMVEHKLQLIFTQRKKQMRFLKQTIVTLTSSSGSGPTYIELQGFM